MQGIIDRRRAAAVIREENKEPRFAEYVFHRNGEPLRDFRKAWATACVAAGVGKIICPRCGSEGTAGRCETCKTETRYSGKIFHDFRRTASRNMIEAGVPQAVAMKITGHRTDSMFRRYAIVNEEQKRDALQKTQKYLVSSKKHKVVRMGAGR